MASKQRLRTGEEVIDAIFADSDSEYEGFDDDSDAESVYSDSDNNSIHSGADDMGSDSSDGEGGDVDHTQRTGWNRLTPNQVYNSPLDQTFNAVPGLKVPVGDVPSDFFFKFFPKGIFRVMAEQTNLSDRKKKQRHQTHYYCEQCDLPMCPEKCFKLYHTEVDYKVKYD